MLTASDGPLVDKHDLFMLDLDGVVYIGSEVVPDVPEYLERLRAAGPRVAFVTNNAARPASVVATRLQGMGVSALEEDVVTSAQAAASLLRSRFGAGARVLVLGGEGLVSALKEVGLVPLTEIGADVVALVTGYGPDVRWSDIMRACVEVRNGLPWFASNTDLTIPTRFGVAPGHGVLVRTIAEFAGVQPVVAGKPSPPLLRETIQRTGAARPIMVGDRLDTDIAGAAALGVPSVLVLTGVTGVEELVKATPDERPTYISPTLAGIFESHPVPGPQVGGGHSLNGWTSRISDSLLTVDGSGSPADWWRVMADAAWAHFDASQGEPVITDRLRPPDA